MGEPVYILLPVHNRRAITVRMAEALRGQTLQDFVQEMGKLTAKDREELGVMLADELGEEITEIVKPV